RRIARRSSGSAVRRATISPRRAAGERAGARREAIVGMKFRVPGLHEWTPIRGWTPFGAPVFLHITALVAFVLLVALTLASPIHGLLAIGCYFAIILGHELGHA